MLFRRCKQFVDSSHRLVFLRVCDVHTCPIAAPCVHGIATDEDRIRAMYRMRLAMWLCRCRRVRMLIHRNLSSLSGYQVSFIQVSLYTRCVALQGEAASARATHLQVQVVVEYQERRAASRAPIRDAILRWPMRRARTRATRFSRSRGRVRAGRDLA